MGDDVIERFKREGKVLVETGNGTYEPRSQEHANREAMLGNLVSEEQMVYYPDENGIARACPTGNYTYRKRRDSDFR